MIILHFLLCPQISHILFLSLSWWVHLILQWERESGEKLPHLSNGKYVNLPACVATYRNFSPVTVENCPHSSLSSHTLLRSHLVSPIWNKCSFLHKVLPLFPLFSCLSSCLYSATQQNFSKCGLHLLSFWWLPMFFST